MMSPAKLRKHSVVQYTLKLGPQGTGVVQWLGKDKEGRSCALVRWDNTGELALHDGALLRQATITLRTTQAISATKGEGQ